MIKKILNTFFVTLGVIFFVIILLGVYLYIADPFNLREMVDETIPDMGIADSEEVADGVVEDKHPLLSPTQEKTLETFGVDPAAVPSSITPEQEACFEAELGTVRVNEIKAGDSPTAIEFLKAKDCI